MVKAKQKLEINQFIDSSRTDNKEDPNQKDAVIDSQMPWVNPNFEYYQIINQYILI